nr:TPA_asm: m19.5 ORF [Murid betaherpesvirus 1]DBA07935.1 TPA_asm: m19.5 ORF [Murid betaherpesvirus 1]
MESRCGSSPGLCCLTGTCTTSYTERRVPIERTSCPLRTRCGETGEATSPSDSWLERPAYTEVSSPSTGFAATPASSQWSRTSAPASKRTTRRKRADSPAPRPCRSPLYLPLADRRFPRRPSRRTMLELEASLRSCTLGRSPSPSSPSP